MSESREALIRNLRQFRNQIPRDFKFDREEANSRDREWQSNRLGAIPSHDVKR